MHSLSTCAHFIQALTLTMLATTCGCGNSSSAVKVLAVGKSPQDSAPDSTASQVYFIGSDTRGAGVYRTSGNSAGMFADVFVGSPLLSPRSLVVSPDDKRLYVADPEASGGGAVFVIDSATGALSMVLALGTHPRGIDVRSESGTDSVYFSGQTSGGQPAIWRMRSDGSNLEVLAQGAPLGQPDGVTVSSAGAVYVTDAPEQKGQGRVLKVTSGATTELLSGLDLGNPAGLALTLDEMTLVISARTASADTDQVLLFNLTSQNLSSFTKDIDANRAGGGVHRAKNDNVFTWADRTAGGPGSVYRIELK